MEQSRGCGRSQLLLNRAGSAGKARQDSSGRASFHQKRLVSQKLKLSAGTRQAVFVLANQQGQGEGCSTSVTAALEKPGRCWARSRPGHDAHRGHAASGQVPVLRAKLGPNASQLFACGRQEVWAFEGQKMVLQHIGSG